MDARERRTLSRCGRLGAKLRDLWDAYVLERRGEGRNPMTGLREETHEIRELALTDWNRDVELPMRNP